MPSPVTLLVCDTNAISGNAGFTIYALNTKVPNGCVVSKIGVYDDAADTFKMKIGLRNSAGNFDNVYDESFAHGGTGWEDLTLASPFTVPGTGDYFVGVYCATSYGGTSNPARRAVLAGDATGTGETFGEDTSFTPAMRYTYAASAASGTDVGNYLNTTGSAAAGGFTVVNMECPLPNGAVITDVDLNCTSAISVKIKIAQRTTFATEFTIVYDESMSHGGTGWETLTLASPYTVPDTGDFFLATYSASNLDPTSGDTMRSYLATDQTGGPTTYTAQDNSFAPIMRFDYDFEAVSQKFRRTLSHLGTRMGARQGVAG